jgi:hypothetical protein
MTGGARLSARAAKRLRGKVGLAGPERAAGLRCWAGNGMREKGLIISSFFSKSYSPPKQTNQYEFKPGFESKHSKTMQRHECNSKLLYFLN